MEIKQKISPENRASTLADSVGLDKYQQHLIVRCENARAFLQRITIFGLQGLDGEQAPKLSEEAARFASEKEKNQFVESLAQLQIGDGDTRKILFPFVHREVWTLLRTLRDDTVKFNEMALTYVPRILLMRERIEAKSLVETMLASPGFPAWIIRWMQDPLREPLAKTSVLKTTREMVAFGRLSGAVIPLPPALKVGEANRQYGLSAGDSSVMANTCTKIVNIFASKLDTILFGAQLLPETIALAAKAQRYDARFHCVVGESARVESCSIYR